MARRAVQTVARRAVQSTAGAAVAVVLLATLTACDPGTASSGPSSTPAQSEPSASATESQAVFVAPTSCTDLLGATLEAEVTSDGSVLFSGPGGTGTYPAPSIGQDGGTPVACLYGKGMVDLSTFEFASQGLSQDAHEGTLAELESRGMTETTSGDTVTFTQEGNEGTDPAIVHILRPDSWVTVYSTFGGADRLKQITGWANTVETQVYP